MARPATAKTAADPLDVLAALVLEDGQRWGDVAAPFQWEDARAVLHGAEPYNYLTRARGGAKTSDLAGVAIAAMIAQLPRRSRSYGLAADRDQGRLLLDSIAGYAARTPMLRGALEIGAYRVTATATGCTLDVLAADAPGAWGLRPALLIVDELAQWNETPAAQQLWEAATTAAAKTAGRVAVLTTAGDPTHFAASILEHAKGDPLWRVHEVSGAPPWMNEARLEHERRRLPASSFARLFENQWTAAEDRLATVDDVRACVTLEGALAPEAGTKYVVAVDAGLVRDRTVAVVCHARPIKERVLVESWTGETTDVTIGHHVYLDRMEVWQGSHAAPVELEAVERWIEEASFQYLKAPIRFDPWQLAGTMQRLQAKGYKVEPFYFTTQSAGRVGAVLHQLIRQRTLHLPPDDDLIEELSRVRLVETPSGLRLHHARGEHDDRAVALGIAAMHLIERMRTTGRATMGKSIY